MKTLVILSGGLDSAVLLHQQKQQGEVVALSVNYGQRHARELLAAKVLTERLGVDHIWADMRGAAQVFNGSALTGGQEVPLHVSYADEAQKATIVPNRNMVLLALAASAAISHKAERVAYGAHSGDREIYPDCREEFVTAARRVLSLCDWQPVGLVAPFVHLDKAAVVRLGAELGVPFELTWTCYQGGEKHCGQCGACLERKEAFILAQVRDPTEYLA